MINWKPILGYSGLYEISSHGEVVSFRKGLNMLRPGVGTTGYYLVALGKNNTKKVHRLVAKAFLSNPENKPEVNYINGNPLDNRVENLEWVTHKENMRHCRDVLNRFWLGEKVPQSKLNKKQVKAIKKEFKVRERSLQAMAKSYGISISGMSKIHRGETWAWL